MLSWHGAQVKQRDNFTFNHEGVRLTRASRMVSKPRSSVGLHFWPAACLSLSEEDNLHCSCSHPNIYTYIHQPVIHPFIHPSIHQD